MAASEGTLNGQSTENTGPPITETTPLIPPGPSTIDASAQAAVDLPLDADHSALNGGHTAANQTISRTRALICALALSILILIQATNISMLTTTQSAIARDLDTFETASWFTSAYLIAMSAFSPMAGKLASIFAPRNCIFIASVAMAIGGLVTSAAIDFESFVAGRVITGIGAAGVLTISTIIILELTGSKRRGLAIGLLNSGYTIGVAAGATGAGALLRVVGWRALFYLQAPCAIVGGTILLYAIPHDFTTGGKKSAPDDEESGSESSSGPSTLTLLSQLDYLGATTLTASIVLLLYSLSSPHSIPVIPIILSAIVLVMFVLNEVYLARDPIIPISLLKSRGLLLTCLSTQGFMMARWTVLFYAPTYAIAVRGWSLASAGSILIPTNVGFALGGIAVGLLHIRRQGSFWFPAVVAYAIFPLTLIALALLSTQNSSATLYVLTVTACGAATGAALNYTLAHLLHLTPKSTHYIATSLVATFRGFAGSFGSAIGGGLFTRKLYASLEKGFEDGMLGKRKDLVRRLLGEPTLVGELGAVERVIAIRGYEEALKTLFIAAAVLAVVTVFVQAGTGWTSEIEKTSVLEEQRRVLIQETDAEA